MPPWQSVAHRRACRPPARGWSACRRTGDTVDEIAANDFESLVADGHPEVRRALDFLRDAGLRSVMLSGSGGACFGLARGASEALSTAQRLSDELGWRVSGDSHAGRTASGLTSVTRGDLTDGLPA